MESVSDMPRWNQFVQDVLSGYTDTKTTKTDQQAEQTAADEEQSNRER